MGKLDKITVGEVLQTAESLVTGDRAEQHGDIRENHRNMARMVGAYLGTPISEEQMAGIMVCIKLARTKAGSTNPDDFVDMAAYAGIMGQLATEGKPESLPQKQISANVAGAYEARVNGGRHVPNN